VLCRGGCHVAGSRIYQAGPDWDADRSTGTLGHLEHTCT
jgi:hypothetical protein